MEDIKNQTHNGFSVLLDFSHEIRNPLNGISGITNILLDTSLNSEQKSLVKNIQNKSNQLNEILELILDYSKIINGLVKYSPEQVFTYPFLQKLFDDLFKYFRDKRIRFCYYIPPQLSGIGFFDPYIVTQILHLSATNLPFLKHHSNLNLEIEADGKEIIFNYNYLFDTEETEEISDNQHSQIARLLLVNYLKLIGGHLMEEVQDNEFHLTIKTPVKYSAVVEKKQEIKENNALQGKHLIFFAYGSSSCQSTSRYMQYLGIELQKDERDLSQLNESELDHKYHLLGIDISNMKKHEFQIMDDIRKKSQLPIIMFREALDPTQKILILQKDVVVMYKPVSPNHLSYVISSILESKADQLREWIKNPLSLFADDHNSLKILIADDDSINQRVMREYMTKLHLKADFVSNGKKALELYKENKYDLILMDIQMPIMNGVEAAKLIRENKNNHHPYIVAITADALKGGKETYLSAGMNDFLFKPVSLEGIEKVIQKYISSIRH
jgi:CheY-like chemotaxis protein